MINLSNEQLAALRITRFIFHVVHHGEPEPIFLDEIETGEFESFFFWIESEAFLKVLLLNLTLRLAFVLYLKL